MPTTIKYFTNHLTHNVYVADTLSNKYFKHIEYYSYDKSV